MLHLTSINPHVANTIPRAGALAIPRQTAPGGPAALADGQAEPLWGVSAFAFQGTNAHALLAAARFEASEELAGPRLAWRRSRFWVAPPPHSLVDRVASSKPRGSTIFEAELWRPKQAYLWQHVVSGRPIVPGAAFLETAAACLRIATASGISAGVTMVVGSTIPMPLLLPAAGQLASGRVLLRGQVQTSSGQITLSSASASQTTERQHMHSTACLGQRSHSATAPAQAAERPALRALLAAAPSAARSLAAAVGALAVRQPGVYGISPADVDASLHLGAIPLPGERPVLRVPAAIRGYTSGTGAVAELCAGCQAVSTGRHGIVNNYWLESERGPGLCTVSGLEARVMSAPAVATPLTQHGTRAAAAALDDDSRTLYQLSWQASASGAGMALAPTPRTADLQLRAPAASLCSSAVAVLQCSSGTQGASLATAGMQLAVPAPGRSGAPALGLLYGLVKAAAQEGGARRYATLDADLHGARAGAAFSFGPAAADGSAYGAVLRSGTSLVPVLEPCRVLPAGHRQQRAGQGQSFSASGTTAVIGGTGTLGQLTTQFLVDAELADAGHTFSLLGRSGRLAAPEAFQVLSTLGATSSVCIVLRACDGAAAEDARSVFGGTAMLTGVIHAGGVLADAVLANMDPARIRRAFAAKADTLQHAGHASAGQPAGFQLLFSSVASLLGSPGQANYSASNALLDSLAQAAQAQV